MKDQVKVKWILQKLRYMTTMNLNLVTLSLVTTCKLAKSNQECTVHQNKNMVPGTRHKDYIKGKAFIYCKCFSKQCVCIVRKLTVPLRKSHFTN